MEKEFVGRHEYLNTSIKFMQQLAGAGVNDYSRAVNFVGPGWYWEIKNIT